MVWHGILINFIVIIIVVIIIIVVVIIIYCGQSLADRTTCSHKPHGVAWNADKIIISIINITIVFVVIIIIIIITIIVFIITIIYFGQSLPDRTTCSQICGVAWNAD